MTQNRVVSTLGDSSIDAKNAIINGGMDIWQRGTSFTGAQYTADRWFGQTSGGTTVFARESTIIPTGSQYALKWTQSVSAAYVNIIQAVETANAIRFAGKTVTFSMQVAASASVGCTIEVNYATTVDKTIAGAGWTSISATTGGSATPSSTNYVTLTGTYTIPSTAKSLLIGITTSSIASGVTFYVGNYQMEMGSVATPFSRAGGTIQGELEACQRYYEAQIGNMGFVGSIGNGIAYYAFGRFQVQKRSTSNITIATTNVSGFPASNAIAEQINTSGFRTYLVSNASTSNGFYINNWTADCEL